MKMTIATINQKGVNTIEVKNSTAARLKVIAHRTGNITIAAAKAMLIELWKEKASKGIVSFTYRKRSGELTHRFGSIQHNIMATVVNGNGISRECYCTCAYYDLGSQSVKSFRWENLVAVD